MMWLRRFRTSGSTSIAKSATISPGAVVGKRFRPLLGYMLSPAESERTVVGDRAYIGYYALVGLGSHIGDGTIVDDFCMVESDVTIGQGTLLIYRAHVCNDAEIGRDCIIGGFIGENVVVEDGCRIFGQVVHVHHDPTLSWDAPDSEEPAAVIGRNVFVGFGAIIVGPVTIGPQAYVCAGALVTRDVPAGHIASGRNVFVSPSDWHGSLAESPHFGRAVPSR
jgi:acetyltransferase-like isoleucine patch superfamily enzyme